MRTNDSHVAVARLAADVRSALRGRRDRRVWPYALAPLVLAAADAALNGPAVLASDLSALASGLTHAATQGLALITSGGPR